MELREYQKRALREFDLWFETLRRHHTESEEIAEVFRAKSMSAPTESLNYPKLAWQELADLGAIKDKRYASRIDGMKRPIPHVCFKVPTGGGKTLLAAESLGRIQFPRGLVLWIVPTRAIYEQTKRALWNREHPYRERLERAGGRQVKVLEKDDRLQPADIENYLCVMLLMYPAANRQKGKDFLRFFKDSGLYAAFFPDGDNPLSYGQLKLRYPDLEEEGGMLKQSLFNVIKMLRPVVILDEAHKAYGNKLAGAQEFAANINRLNPRMVMEFSATPNAQISNVLVDITGGELKEEEMIKMPVQVMSLMRSRWEDTLTAAHEKLQDIDNAAVAFQQQENRYIRPIAVVRVERTGRDQRDGQRVHAEDVREYLIRQLGVPAAAIRVKSAENDELGREDLLSEISQVRWIITKAALMEGWDCPFAYMLALLDNTRSQTALTQLVGRILRQPHTRLTGVEALDRCYVYCWNLDVMRAVEQVQSGLKDEGLGDLASHVESADWADPTLTPRTIRRREQFRGLSIKIPKVLHRGRDGWRELNHLQDILAEVNWDDVCLRPFAQSIHEAASIETAEVDVGEQRPTYFDPQESRIDKTLRLSWFTRRLSDVVPNPWQAAIFVQQMFVSLQDSGMSEDEIFDDRARLVDQLKSHLREERDRLCKAIYEEKLHAQRIRFDFCTEPMHEMPGDDDTTILLGEKDHTLERGGIPIQLSFLEQVFEKQFDSDLERDFAWHLEKQPLEWWHRVKREYYVVGWRPEKIYPDFVTFADRHFGLFETKGGHLRNRDTVYKSQVFELLQEHFNSSACNVRVQQRSPDRGQFEIVYDHAFPAVVA